MMQRTMAIVRILSDISAVTIPRISEPPWSF
jgi:hypothetical protein